MSCSLSPRGCNCTQAFSKVEVLDSYVHQGLSGFGQSFYSWIEPLNPKSREYSTFIQRIWRVLPTTTYLTYKVVFFLCPFYRTRFVSSFQALDVLARVRKEGGLLTEKEKKDLSNFFTRAQNEPAFLTILRAGAHAEQYKTLNFVQGLFYLTDSKSLEDKLSHMQQVLVRWEQGDHSMKGIVPLTVDDLGKIQLASPRKEFLQFFQKEEVDGVDVLVEFWEKMESLQDHPTIVSLRQRAKDLVKGCKVAVMKMSREHMGRHVFNLGEDSSRYIKWTLYLQYIGIGDPVHLAFLISQEDEQFFSHLTSNFGTHEMNANKDIFYPCWTPFSLNICPLLSNEVSSEHASLLQDFFSRTLKELAAVKQATQLDTFRLPLEAFFLGSYTPCWSQRQTSTLQEKEICTGFMAKLILQAYEKTVEKMQQLGYKQDHIAPLFHSHQHIGRLTNAAFLHHFQQRGMLEPLEDPILTALIAS